jgi:hypothetical protein
MHDTAAQKLGNLRADAERQHGRASLLIALSAKFLQPRNSIEKGSASILLAPGADMLPAP